VGAETIISSGLSIIPPTGFKGAESLLGGLICLGVGPPVGGCAGAVGAGVIGPPVPENTGDGGGTFTVPNCPMGPPPPPPPEDAGGGVDEPPPPPPPDPPAGGGVGVGVGGGVVSVVVAVLRATSI